MHFIQIVICSYLIFPCNGNIEEKVIVSILNGKIEGKVLTSRTGKNYNAFLGIPYGKADRFEAAIEPTWNGTLYKASEFGPECAQFDKIRNEIVGEELQCLTLNVYAAKQKFASKMPVIVWLHGGGYSFGSSNLYSEKYFMDEPVILITLNYRLGVFGFLDIQDSLVPANLGLRDQRLALDWVRKNVIFFGGDPENVCLAGSSAGASSVALHMLTDTSQFFHKAISQSGTSLSSWLIQRNPRENALHLADQLNCTSKSIVEMVQCIKSKNVKQILNAVSEFKLGSSVSKVNFLFTPSVESSESENAYLTECPEKLMQDVNFKSKIPWMVGFNENEGILNLGSILGKDELIEEIVSNWTLHAPWLFLYNYDTDSLERNAISEKIKNTFLLSKNGQIDFKNFWKILPVLVSDRWDVLGTIKSLKLLGHKTPIYPYIFSYFGNFSHANGLFGLKERHGVGHLDELQYLFEGVFGAPVYNKASEMRHFSQLLVKLWVQFAKTGVPRTDKFTDWNPVNVETPIHLYKINDIYSDKKPVSVETFQERMKFWDSTVAPSCNKSKIKIKQTEL